MPVQAIAISQRKAERAKPAWLRRGSSAVQSRLNEDSPKTGAGHAVLIACLHEFPILAASPTSKHTNTQ
jgi:hypothetical protein